MGEEVKYPKTRFMNGPLYPYCIIGVLHILNPFCHTMKGIVIFGMKVIIVQDTSITHIISNIFAYMTRIATTALRQ